MPTIGNYEFKMDNNHLLGKGSFSNVYRGKHINKDLEVAVKIINLENMTIKARSIINDEVEIMESIKYKPHPNIVECYDIVIEDDMVYIIMEYCDSGNLSNIIKKPIKEEYVQLYFSQLANGLKYLQENNIVHRDIKPRNILLTNNRRILKIADFGFAKKSIDSSLYETICGSPMYMAPEIMGKQNYNKQTDLWSIGMILYEMLYGYHPYRSCKSLPEIKSAIGNDNLEIPPSNNKNKDVSLECLNLLRKLLQKDVDNRITWSDFFNHPWINKYQYINTQTNKPNENYKDQICSKSMDSLISDKEYNDAYSYSGSYGSPNSINSLGSGNSSTRGSKINIIPRFYDTLTLDDVEKQQIKLNDDLLFDLEFDDHKST